MQLEGKVSVDPPISCLKGLFVTSRGALDLNSLGELREVRTMRTVG